MDAPSPGGLGGTYAGNPVACAAAHAVLDAIEEENLCERANAIGKIILDRCNQLKTRSNLNCIGDVRGLGAMCAIELVKDTASGEPAPQLTQALMKVANENGLDPALLRHLWQCDPFPCAAHRERCARARGHGYFRDEPHRSRYPGRVSL